MDFNSMVILGLVLIGIGLLFLILGMRKSMKNKASSEASSGAMSGSTMRNSAVDEVYKRKATSIKSNHKSRMGGIDDGILDDVEDVLVASSILADAMSDDYEETYNDEPYTEEEEVVEEPHVEARETYNPPQETYVPPTRSEPTSDWSSGNSNDWGSSSDSGGDSGGDD